MGFSTNLRGLRTTAMAVLVSAAEETNKKINANKQVSKPKSWNLAAKKLFKIRLMNV